MNLPSLPPLRVAIVGSRFGKISGVEQTPPWRDEALESARKWVKETVSTLAPSALLIVSSEPIGVGAWALNANRGKRPEMHYRPGALADDGRTEPELCAWPVDLATHVFVAWDGRSRAAYRLADYAQRSGKLYSLRVFDRATPEGRQIVG